METQRKLIIGYDLCEDLTQITCYSYKNHEPIPISASMVEEKYEIPTALCVRKDTKMWLFGDEAVNCAQNNGGFYVDQLLTKLKEGEEVSFLDQRLTGIMLIEKFLRKTLTLVKNYFPTEQITQLVITVQDMDSNIVNGIYEALSVMEINKDRVMVIGHPTAYLYYALSQDKSLWTNDVGLFHFDETGLYYYQISINRKSIPCIAALTKKEFTSIMNFPMLKSNQDQLPYTFTNIVNTVLHKQIVSTLYFTGKGFEGDWATQSIQGLCTGRRAFVGSNLYTKGACYAAKEISGDQQLDQYILLHDDMINNAISIRVFSDAKWKELLLVDAATPWYDVRIEVEVIPDEIWEIEFIFKHIVSREVNREKITLKPLANRPNRMTRLGILMECIDRDHLKIITMDLGFGELYKGTGIIDECMIEMR